MLRITAPWIAKRITRRKVALAAFVLLAGATAILLYASQGGPRPSGDAALPAAIHPEYITRAEFEATAWQWIAAIVLSNAVVIGGMLWGGGSSYRRIANNSGRIEQAVVEKARDEVALEVRFDKGEARRIAHDDRIQASINNLAIQAQRRDSKIQSSIDDLALQARQTASDLVLLTYKVEAVSAVNFGYTDR